MKVSRIVVYDLSFHYNFLTVASIIFVCSILLSQAGQPKNEVRYFGPDDLNRKTQQEFIGIVFQDKLGLI